MVNTFLPYPDFDQSVSCLDYRRLGKQRVECDQIIGILLGTPNKEGKPRTGWRNHTVVRMWRGYTGALMLYMNASVREWVQRGYNNSYKLWTAKQMLDAEGALSMPPWLGDIRLHSSHRGALLFKEYEWYKKFNWPEKPVKEYFWPC